MNLDLLERLPHWLLLALTAVYLLTGLGITQYHIVESLTFGLLSKNLSFRIHEVLLAPFIVTLVLHVLIRPLKRIFGQSKKEN